MAKNSHSPGAYYTSSARKAGESEGSGCSGRVNMDIDASEDSLNPKRKCISLSSNKQDIFYVPTRVLALSRISASQREGLVLRLRAELDQLWILKKRIESQRKKHATLSSSSDIPSCSNIRNGSQTENACNSFMMKSGPGKILGSESVKDRRWSRSTSGIESRSEAPIPSSTCLFVLRQCENLLKQLMSHRFARVFSTPVDVVKLKLPDYFSIIEHPMDLGTVKGKLTAGVYLSPLEFLADIRLTFSNAITYNPSGNDVHIMAKSLSKIFEARWKSVEKKIPATMTDAQIVPQTIVSREETESAKRLPPSKRRKIISLQHPAIPEPVVERIMTDKEKNVLGRDLEYLLAEMPTRIIYFLRDHSTNGEDTAEDEIEIDIDEFSNGTLFTLRGLVDDCLQEKQKSQKAVHCEMELLNGSGVTNSSMQPCKENDTVNIGGNEIPVSSYPPVDIDKDSDSTADNEAGRAEASVHVNVSKVLHHIEMGAEPDAKTSVVDKIETNQPVSAVDQVEVLQQTPNSMELDYQQDGENAPIERPMSPEKLYRAALLKNRFADTILKAREKTLKQGEKGDPGKLRKEKEQLEIQRKKEKALLQAEAKAAENARRRAEAESVAEAKRKREQDREAARQALLKIEKTVEINENSRFLEDLEMLSTAPAKLLPISVHETNPENSLDNLGRFKFGGCNPLEQLGLFMKDEDDEEECEQLNALNPLKILVLYMKKNDNVEDEEGELPSMPNPLEQFGLFMKKNDNDGEEEGELPYVPTSNPLEQFGLFMKKDDDNEEEEGELQLLNSSEQLGLDIKKDVNDKEDEPSCVPIAYKQLEGISKTTYVPYLKSDVEEGEID